MILLVSVIFFQEEQLKPGTPQEKQVIVLNNRKPGKFCCKHCTYKTNIWNDFKVHSRTHTNTKLHEFHCSHCAATFTQKRYLIFHMGKHPENTLHMCYGCDFKTEQLSDLRIHQRLHSAIQPRFKQRVVYRHEYGCKICDYSTKYQRCLRRHQEIIHQEIHTK